MEASGEIKVWHFAAAYDPQPTVECAPVIINEHRVKPSEANFWRSESDADSRLGGETARHLALRWVVRLRYGLIVGEVALIAVLSFGLQIALPVIVIAPAIGIQALSNWLLRLKMNR